MSRFPHPDARGSTPEDTPAAAAAGTATIVFITAFGAAGGHGGLPGLWERAAGGATSVLTVAVLARLAIISRPGARARRGPAAGGRA